MKQSRLIQKAKRFVAGVITLAMTVTMFPAASAVAEEPQEKYPYTLFAASEADGAITITGNACVNGNIATNGTAVVTGSAINVNGIITEQVNEKMINISAKLDELYFAGENVEDYAENYVSEDVNCNISNPTVVRGTMEVKGNVNLNAPVKVSENITLQTDSLNANNAVIYSENGDISISGNNVNFTGLLYAPEGEVKIQAQHVNLNSIIVIADTITLETGNANINYNQNMAEIVGVTSGEETTEPDKEPTVLYLLGKYNEENHSIDMEWYTNATEADVMVWTSEDNVTYEQEATVTGETAYQYVIAEEFETKYFKASVMDEQGEIVETVPFVVVKSENGYSLSALDSDGDGVADEYELLVGTDVNSPDTDGDTLTDYEELYISQTDATKFDSVTEGLSDAEADSDGDKLSNREEMEFATDVQDADTDNDTLTDYEEIEVYNTSPLKADTDGDTLKDGDELALGLDPLNSTTFGVPDAEYTVEQTISADSVALEEINTDENEYRLAVGVTASGYVEGNLTAKETGYAAAIQNEFMVGIASELSYANEDGIESVTLTFELDNEVIEDSLGLFQGVEELSGIKRFNVFKYFEELNMLLPIETVVDEENNRIYATTDELGTYCVMDMERWLASFEVPEEVYQDVPVMFSMRPAVSGNETADERIIIDCIGTPQDMELVDAATVDEAMVEEEALTDAPMMFALKRDVDKTPVDVVFLLQSSGQLENTFINQKTMIYELLADLGNEYGRGNVRFAVITYNLSGAEFLTSATGDIWFSSANALSQALYNLEYEYTSGYTDRGTALQKLQNEVEFKDNASKFIFQVMNGSTDVGNRYFDQISTCEKLGINYSELMPEGYIYLDPTYGQQVADAIASTNGMNVTYGSSSQLQIYKHIVAHAAPPQMEFDAIVPTGWKHIVLDGILDAENGVNSDTDELTDWEEVNTELISWDTDGTVILPTIQDCITKVDDAYARDGLKRYRESVCDREEPVPGMPTSDFLKYLDYVINSTNILPIHSDPTEADTDSDGLLDGTRVFFEGKVLLPADQEPFKYNGPEGVWLKQAEMVREGSIPTRYTSLPSFENELMNELAGEADLLVDILLNMEVVANEVIIDWFEEKFKDSAEGTAALVTGADFLDFIRDNHFMAYHSQVETWQKAFGYNEIYDRVFEYGSEMHMDKIPFIYDGEVYMIWMWKGDYWNLEGGAETGLYIYDRTVNGIDHYNVVDFNLPMTLSLYKRDGNKIENVFCWAPEEKQWWITGFNPDYTEPIPKDMITICSIDFTEKSEMWGSIVNDLSIYDNIMFDEEYHTVWIVWDQEKNYLSFTR